MMVGEKGNKVDESKGAAAGNNPKKGYKQIWNKDQVCVNQICVW